jgi:predicted MFS family arabinose efflux permease
MALLSVSSVVGALLYGRRTWQQGPGRRLVFLVAGISVAGGGLAIADSPVLFTGMIAALGLLLTPTMVTGFLLVDILTPEQTRTEASSWINTANNAGINVGAAMGGLLVDHVSLAGAFGAGATLAVLCTLAAASRARSMDPASQEEVPRSREPEVPAFAT